MYVLMMVKYLVDSEIIRIFADEFKKQLIMVTKKEIIDAFNAFKEEHGKKPNVACVRTGNADDLIVALDLDDYDAGDYEYNVPYIKDEETYYYCFGGVEVLCDKIGADDDEDIKGINFFDFYEDEAPIAYSVLVDEVNDGGLCNKSTMLFKTHDSAKKYFDSLVDEFKEALAEIGWDEGEANCDDYYEAYEDGYFDSNHVLYTIEKKIIH